MQHNADFYIERLLNHYNLNTISELAGILGIKQTSISSWRTRNSVNAIKKKCRELGIYDEIFTEKTYGLFKSKQAHTEFQELWKKELALMDEAGVNSFESFKKFKEAQANYKPRIENGIDWSDYDIGLEYETWLNLKTQGRVLIGVDDATYTLFKEAYDKAKENDDLKGFRVHLMEY